MAYVNGYMLAIWCM